MPGRHRVGTPGLTPLAAMISLPRRSLLQVWRYVGRHRLGRTAGQMPTQAPRPAHAL